MSTTGSGKSFIASTLSLFDLMFYVEAVSGPEGAVQVKLGETKQKMTRRRKPS
jgi:hypothetical protein